MDTENASELDLFTMPSGSHASTFGSPNAHLNNEKMLTNEDEDNSNEKEIDNLDALVNERAISLDLVFTQHLFRRASNFVNEVKNCLVLGQDCNHIISVRLQINEGISANGDCSKIIYVNYKRKVVYCLQVRQRRFLQGDLEQITEPPDPGGSVNFFRNYVKFCPDFKI